MVDTAGALGGGFAPSPSRAQPTNAAIRIEGSRAPLFDTPPVGVAACPVCGSVQFRVIFHRAQPGEGQEREWAELLCYECARWLGVCEAGAERWTWRPVRLSDGALISGWYEAPKPPALRHTASIAVRKESPRGQGQRHTKRSSRSGR